MALVLKDRFPGAVYRASIHVPDVGEDDDTSPRYVLCEKREVHILLKPYGVNVWFGGECEAPP